MRNQEDLEKIRKLLEKLGREIEQRIRYQREQDSSSEFIYSAQRWNATQGRWEDVNHKKDPRNSFYEWARRYAAKETDKSYYESQYFNSPDSNSVHYSDEEREWILSHARRRPTFKNGVYGMDPDLTIIDDINPEFAWNGMTLIELKDFNPTPFYLEKDPRSDLNTVQKMHVFKFIRALNEATIINV